MVRQTASTGVSLLDVRGHDRANAGTEACFLLPFETVDALPASGAPRRVRRRRWRRHVGAVLTPATPSWPALRTGLRADISLLAFQLEPALAVLSGHAARVLVADDVGLGKTIQAALIVAEALARTRHGRALVVAPASLKEQWQSELLSRFHLDAWVADTASLADLGARWRGLANPWSAHRVVVTSIDFVKRPDVIRSLESLVWDVVVFDEAHGLSGRSDRAAAAHTLARRARTVVLLTATPHNGDDRAFERLCGIGDIDHLFPIAAFRRTREDAGLPGDRRTISLKVQPSLAEREMHRALMAYARLVWKAGRGRPGARLAMMVLVRRASSSPHSLARSVERRLSLLRPSSWPGPAQLRLPLVEGLADDEPGWELAAPGLADGVEEQRRLERILYLARRAQATDSKLRRLERFLHRTKDVAIVFTEYRDTLAMLEDRLRALDPLTLHGGLTPAERRRVLTSFTTGPSRLLLTTDAGSEGLNLHQRCRLVINLELPWTPLRLEQRIGRVDRIGQPHRVHAVHLLASGTAEEESVARLVLRARRAGAVTGGLRTPYSEADVGGAVIGRDAPDEESNRRTITLHAPERRQAAIDEALRLEGLRRLSRHSSAWPDARPPVYLRRQRGERGTLCAFRLLIHDSHEFVLWESLLGVWVSTSLCTLDAWHALSARLAPVLDAAGDRVRARFIESARHRLDTLTRREVAIARALGEDRARLSAGLLQPGLFDRRVERIAAEQRRVLDAALATCRVWLDELERARSPRVDTRLAFGLVRR